MTLWPFSKRPVIVIATCDTHSNSRVGLCPADGVELEDGFYQPSREQIWLWDCWVDIWNKVHDLKGELKAKVYHIHAGDGIDDNHHSKYGLITLNKSIMVKLAEESLAPSMKVSDFRFFVRGTAAHVGQDAELEELVAERCDAVQDGSYSKYEWRLIAGGVYFLARHRPPSTSLKEHTRGGGANRSAVQLTMQFARLGMDLPQVALFGHYHHPEDSGENFPIRALFLPCFKLHGSYESERGFAAEPIGARVFICEGGKYSLLPIEDWTYLPEEDKPWTE